MTIGDATSTDVSSHDKQLPRKRRRASSRIASRQLKRQKTSTLDIQQVARVFQECDYEKMGTNRVWLSQELFNRIYPKSKLEDQKYIKVAHYIYQIGGLTDMEGYQIGVNEVQKKLDLDDYVSTVDSDEGLQVRPYNEDQVNYRNIEHVVFKIQPYGHLQTQGRRGLAVKLSVEELRQTIIETYKGHFFEMGQHAFLNLNEGPMQVKVVERTYEDDAFEELRHGRDVPRHGVITENTHIDFQTSSYRIELVQEQDLSKVRKLHFQITKVDDVSQRVMGSFNSSVNDAWKKGNLPVPLVLEKPTFFKQVRDLLRDKLISVGYIADVRFNRDWILKLKFTKVELTDDIDVDDSRYEYEKHYEKTFKLQDDHSMSISPGSRCVLTASSEHARKAERMKFVIVGWEINSFLGLNEKITVSAEKIEEHIRTNFLHSPVKGRIVIEVGPDKFLVEVESAVGKPAAGYSPEDNVKDLWSIDEETDIRLRASDPDTINLVDTSVPVEVSKIYVKVEKPASGMGGLMMLFGGGEEEKSQIVKEAELLELFREKQPSVLLRKQSFSATTSKSEKLLFTCENFEYEGKGVREVKHGLLYKITPETEIEIDTEKESKLVIESEPEQIEYDKIPERLKELGVGGLPHTCYDYIRDTILSRGPYAIVYQALDKSPERGVIIYGPPGTGKTEIARNIGKLLNVPTSRISFATGSGLLNKYVGETEKNIRELYKPARESFEEHGDKAPLHLVIVDEGENIIGSRKKADRNHQKDKTNAFLTCIDGIQGKSGKTLPNVITIVLTNHIDDVDDAAKRPGRLGTHIEVGIPDAVGRRDIFEIHAKKEIEKGLISEAALGWLVQKTTGKNGAFIQGMVKKAVDKAIVRLVENGVPPEGAFDSPFMQLKKTDFDVAFHQMSNTDIGQECLQDIVIPPEVQFSNLRQQFKRQGVVGLPSKLISVVQDVILTRYVYKDEMAQVSYNAPRSLLIYGPSGTGKTSFVNALPKILNLPRDRFQKYSSSDLWQDWQNNLKEQLKTLFEPAIQASKDLKDDSQLFVVVMEDIDRLFKLSKRSKIYESSLMNDFLSEIEIAFNEKVGELLHGRHQKISNLLVVGTMTISKELHSDTIGYGQQCVHVEMELPTAVGRKELFHHYLEPFYDKKRLDKDVNLDRLVDLTSKRSGEFIAAVVTKAATYPLHRHQLSEVLKEIGYFDKETFDINEVDEGILQDIKDLANINQRATRKEMMRQLKHVPPPQYALEEGGPGSMEDDDSPVTRVINPITQDDLERAIIECNTDKLKEARERWLT